MISPFDLDECQSIDRAEFDRLARAGEFAEGPYQDSFGDSYGDPYRPRRAVYGVLRDGRMVRA